MVRFSMALTDFECILGPGMRLLITTPLIIENKVAATSPTFETLEMRDSSLSVKWLLLRPTLQRPDVDMRAIIV